jgi:hypothetical protein
MTSRMHAPHTTCPGCHEEVFLDELVSGKCPLCGCSLEEFEDSFGDFEGIIERSDLSWLIFNYFVFKQFVELGVPPQQIMEFVTAYEDNADKPIEEWTKTDFVLEISFGWWDRVRLKVCSKCGKWFVNGGKKLIAGDMRRPNIVINYLCTACSVKKPD